MVPYLPSNIDPPKHQKKERRYEAETESLFLSDNSRHGAGAIRIGSLLAGAGEAQAVSRPSSTRYDRITLDSAIDPWSGGTMEVGGQRVIIPKNLLMDLPANRMTLQQFMLAAPGLCPALGQSGLARADSPFCNTSGQPGYALFPMLNRTDGGNIIAGDVFISKGLDAVEGTVTFIDYNNGYLRLNGNLGDGDHGRDGSH